MEIGELYTCVCNAKDVDDFGSIRYSFFIGCKYKIVGLTEVYIPNYDEVMDIVQFNNNCWVLKFHFDYIFIKSEDLRDEKIKSILGS